MGKRDDSECFRLEINLFIWFLFFCGEGGGKGKGKEASNSFLEMFRRGINVTEV